MSSNTITIQSTGFKAGWILLLIVSALSVLNHAVLTFVFQDQAVLFIGWTAFNLYSTLVLFFPFRRGEKWAWYASWILVIPYASLIFFDAEVGPYYLGAAVLMGVGLLLTRPAFFQRG